MTATVAPLTTTPPVAPPPVRAAGQAREKLSRPGASLAALVLAVLWTLPTFGLLVTSIRPALVVVLTTIAIATLKVFDIVRTVTGGQFGTSVVANEFYSQTFRADDQGLGSALAVLLFVLVVPIVVYNVRQLRASEAR